MTEDKPTPEPTEPPPTTPAASQAAPVILSPKKAELVTGGSVVPIVPRNVEEVVRYSQAVYLAGLAPDSYTKGCDKETAVSRIMVGIMKGAEVGYPPLTALASIAIINGRPCLWGDGAVGLVQASGRVEDWKEEITGTGMDMVATCSIKRRGQESPYVGTFSMEKAKRARLLSKAPWIEHPERMCMWRARTYAMRDGFADCLMGLSIAEEAQDLPVVPGPVNTGFLTDDTPDGQPDAPTPDTPK